MSTDLKAIMDRDKRRRRMLNDPDLTGDLLLFALALDEHLTLRKEAGRKKSRSWAVEVAEIAHGREPYYLRYWAKRVIADDAPRYQPEREKYGFYTCVAPMIRREGLCGKSAGTLIDDHDPDTGVARRIGLCSRHKGLGAHYEARRQAWIANGAPVPPANTGGVLRRHFNADWDRVYEWASGKAPMEGGREATPPRPKLRLIQGEGDMADGR